MSSKSLLTVRGLTKQFGHHTAVRNLDLDVLDGAVFGLLGPNGAGKSTTIRIIMRIIEADEGSISLEGAEVTDEVRRRIGYLPEERGLYRKMKIIDQLVFLGNLRGISRAEARKRSLVWLDRFKLGEWADKKVETLSKGMSQKLQIIGTLLSEPRLIILDEPFSGLDPIATRELKNLILELAGNGTTVILSTHVLPQVDELCSHICLINKAQAILDGPLDEIRSRFGGNAWVIGTELSEQRLCELPAVASAKRTGTEAIIDLAPGADSQQLLGQVLGVGQVLSFAPFKPSLENIFLHAVREDEQAN